MSRHISRETTAASRRSGADRKIRSMDGAAEVRGWRILLQPELLPNGIDYFRRSLPDIGHYRRLRFLEIGHLTGQNGLPGEVPVPLVNPFGDQGNASLE